MPPLGGHAVDKIRRDHEHLLELIQRIDAECDQQGVLSSCADCHSSHRAVCHGNIEQLIRAFIESTLKHNFIESMFMEDLVPEEHRIAHNRAHMAIAGQLKEIRVIFSEDNNGILAVEGIQQVRQSLLDHFRDFDQQLEGYLVEAGTVDG